MKTFISFWCRRACLSFALVLAGLPVSLMADQKLQEPSATLDSAGYDLEIEDGQLIRAGRKVEATLPNIVDALRARYTDANIVLAPNLTKVKVGDLRLRAGRLGEELQAVRVASGDKFEIEVPNGPTIDQTTGFPIAYSQNGNASLLVLRESKPRPETRRIVEAFNIGPYLEWSSHQNTTNHPSEDETLREVQGMISETLAAFETQSNQGEPPSFQYHRGATMLVIIGNIESVEIARKIVNALPGMNAVADSSRARYGFEPPRDSAAEDRANREAAAQAAFAARYGMTRPARGDPQSGTAAPQPVPQK